MPSLIVKNGRKMWRGAVKVSPHPRSYKTFPGDQRGQNAALKAEVEALTLARDAAIREIGKWSGKAGRLEAVVGALRKLCGEAAQYILVMDIPDAMASDYHDRLHRAAKGES